MLNSKYFNYLHQLNFVVLSKKSFFHQSLKISLVSGLSLIGKWCFIQDKGSNESKNDIDETQVLIFNEDKIMTLDMIKEEENYILKISMRQFYFNKIIYACNGPKEDFDSFFTIESDLQIKLFRFNTKNNLYNLIWCFKIKQKNIEPMKLIYENGFIVSLFKNGYVCVVNIYNENEIFKLTFEDKIINAFALENKFIIESDSEILFFSFPDLNLLEKKKKENLLNVFPFRNSYLTCNKEQLNFELMDKKRTILLPENIRESKIKCFIELPSFEAIIYFENGSLMKLTDDYQLLLLYKDKDKEIQNIKRFNDSTFLLFKENEIDYIDINSLKRDVLIKYINNYDISSINPLIITTQNEINVFQNKSEKKIIFEYNADANLFAFNYDNTLYLLLVSQNEYFVFKGINDNYRRVQLNLFKPDEKVINAFNISNKVAFVHQKGIVFIPNNSSTLIKSSIKFKNISFIIHSKNQIICVKKNLKGLFFMLSDTGHHSVRFVFPFETKFGIFIPNKNKAFFTSGNSIYCLNIYRETVSFSVFYRFMKEIKSLTIIKNKLIVGFSDGMVSYTTLDPDEKLLSDFKQIKLFETPLTIYKNLIISDKIYVISFKNDNDISIVNLTTNSYSKPPSIAISDNSLFIFNGNILYEFLGQKENFSFKKKISEEPILQSIYENYEYYFANEKGIFEFNLKNKVKNVLLEFGQNEQFVVMNLINNNIYFVIYDNIADQSFLYCIINKYERIFKKTQIDFKGDKICEFNQFIIVANEDKILCVKEAKNDFYIITQFQFENEKIDQICGMDNFLFVGIRRKSIIKLFMNKCNQFEICAKEYVPRNITAFASYSNYLFAGDSHGNILQIAPSFNQSQQIHPSFQIGTNSKIIKLFDYSFGIYYLNVGNSIGKIYEENLTKSTLSFLKALQYEVSNVIRKLTSSDFATTRKLICTFDEIIDLDIINVFNSFNEKNKFRILQNIHSQLDINRVEKIIEKLNENKF